MTQETPNLSVVIPSFGCEGTISELIRRIFSLEASLGSVEVIVVDDASNDESWKIVKELTKKYLNLIAVRLPRNRGQHYAVTKGVSRSSGRIVATIDCDLEFEPEAIIQMVANLDDLTDCVVAESGSVRKDRLPRRLLRRLYHSVMSSITGSENPGSETLAYNFIVARGDVVRRVFQNFPPSDPISTKLLTSDLELRSHPVVRSKRHVGFSSYSVSENLQIVSRSILGSGRGGEIFCIRVAVRLAVSSLLVGTSWLTLGFIERNSGLRDFAFLVMMSLFFLTTIASVLVLALQIMTSVLHEIRSLRNS